MATSPEEIINQSKQLASLPTIYHQISDAVEDPECSFSKIGHIISGDPSLSGRLLKIVNSSFYGFQNKIETITHAITIIGTAQLRDLALATTVIEQFNGVSQKEIDMKKFWEHSIACGLTARILATYCHERNIERYYVLGILHDLGRLIMLINIPEQMNEAMNMAREEKIMLYEAEKKLLGFDHADMGCALISAWNLSDIFRQAVSESHGSYKNGKPCKDASVLHVADMMIHALQLGTSGESHVPPLDVKAWEALGLAPSILATVINLLDNQLADAQQMFL